MVLHKDAKQVSFFSKLFEISGTRSTYQLLPTMSIYKESVHSTYICTYLFMLCYVCHLPELWKRGMAWPEPWKRGMARPKPWKRGVARLEPWEGGMAGTKQWEKKR